MKETSIRKLVCFGLSVMVAWAFVQQGWMKTPWFKGNDVYASKFRDWDLSSELMLPIGLIEIAVGILVLFPRVSSIGASIGFAIMVGATYTHVSTGVGKPWFAVVLAMLSLAVVVLRWPESVLNRSDRT